jgi:hypothetical protein
MLRYVFLFEKKVKNRNIKKMHTSFILYYLGLPMSPEKFLFLSQLRKVQPSLKKGATTTSCTFLTKSTITLFYEKSATDTFFRVTEK